MFLMPCPPNYSGPPPHGPTGTWNAAEPPTMMGIKLILMKTPAPFKGEHNDIDQFLGDCQTYFEAFRQYFLNIPSLTVVFATSHLEGIAQDWWVHLHNEYWYILPVDDKDDKAGP